MTINYKGLYIIDYNESSLSMIRVYIYDPELNIERVHPENEYYVASRVFNSEIRLVPWKKNPKYNIDEVCDKHLLRLRYSRRAFFYAEDMIEWIKEAQIPKHMNHLLANKEIEMSHLCQ